MGRSGLYRKNGRTQHSGLAVGRRTHAKRNVVVVVGVVGVRWRRQGTATAVWPGWVACVKFWRSEIGGGGGGGIEPTAGGGKLLRWTAFFDQLVR